MREGLEKGWNILSNPFKALRHIRATSFQVHVRPWDNAWNTASFEGPNLFREIPSKNYTGCPSRPYHVSARWQILPTHGRFILVESAGTRETIFE